MGIFTSDILILDDLIRSLNFNKFLFVDIL